MIQTLVVQVGMDSPHLLGIWTLLRVVPARAQGHKPLHSLRDSQVNKQFRLWERVVIGRPQNVDVVDLLAQRKGRLERGGVIPVELDMRSALWDTRARARCEDDRFSGFAQELSKSQADLAPAACDQSCHDLGSED